MGREKQGLRFKIGQGAAVVALTAGTLFAGAALASQPAGTAAANPAAAPAREVLICSSDAATRRAFAREYGAEAVFVTAEQALAARDAGERWAAPRCMTAREHERLVRLTSAWASR
jgi:hypothetical protein